MSFTFNSLFVRFFRKGFFDIRFREGTFNSLFVRFALVTSLAPYVEAPSFQFSLREIPQEVGAQPPAPRLYLFQFSLREIHAREGTVARDLQLIFQFSLREILVRFPLSPAVSKKAFQFSLREIHGVEEL